MKVDPCCRFRPWAALAFSQTSPWFRAALSAIARLLRSVLVLCNAAIAALYSVVVWTLCAAFLVRLIEGEMIGGLTAVRFFIAFYVPVVGGLLIAGPFFKASATDDDLFHYKFEFGLALAIATIIAFLTIGAIVDGRGGVHYVWLVIALAPLTIWLGGAALESYRPLQADAEAGS